MIWENLIMNAKNFRDVQIVLKKKGETEEIYQTLLKGGYDVEQLPGVLLVYLPRDGKIEIPSCMDKFITLLNSEEQGGYFNTYGASVIICGISGKKIKPFYIPAKKEIGRPHAFFSLPKSLIRIEADSNKQTKIIKYEAVFSNDALIQKTYIELKCTVLWSGSAGAEAKMLPSVYEKYSFAVRAALKKAACPECKEVHFGII